MASGLLPKSPVSSSLCDEVPHIFIQKSHLEPREFLISSAKRLLQHNRYKADIQQPPINVRFQGKRRHQIEQACLLTPAIRELQRVRIMTFETKKKDRLAAVSPKSD